LITEQAEQEPVYKKSYTLIISGIHFRLTFELFISKLYWNFIDENDCVKVEFKLCYNNFQGFVSFGYIKLPCLKIQLQITIWNRIKYTFIQSQC